jgi:glucosamine--fructose-6-phosphate aminotransferase (isomerizing)
MPPRPPSPLILGVGDGENFLASDIPAVMRYTKRVLVLEDGDFAVIRREGITLSTLDGAPLHRDEFLVTWTNRQQRRAAIRTSCSKRSTSSHAPLQTRSEAVSSMGSPVRLTELDGFTREQLGGFYPDSDRRLRHRLPCGHGRQAVL